MTQVYFSYDVVKLRVFTGENHFYSGYKYNDGPLFRTFEDAKAEALHIAQTDFLASSQTTEALEKLTIQDLAASDSASHSTYVTYVDNLGTKTDVVLTLRALAADSKESPLFYSYHLASLGVPIVENPKRLYDTVTYRHGPMYAEFEGVKAAVLKMCLSNNYEKLYEQVWGMSKDVMNIGKWHKGFKEDFESGLNGLQELRLDVFRTQVKS